MSEREELFFTRAESCLEALNKTKAWYRNAAIVFTMSILFCASGAGVFGYRLGRMDSEMDTFATKKSVELLMQSNEVLVNTYSCLIDDRFEDADKTFQEGIKVINDNIFFFTTERENGK